MGFLLQVVIWMHKIQYRKCLDKQQQGAYIFSSIVQSLRGSDYERF